MGKFFRGIAEKLKRIRKSDPLFGSMTFMGEKLKYWEGRAIFSPGNSEIEVFVNGDKEGDFRNQYEFFRRVCEEWPELSSRIAPKLLEVYSRVNEVPPVALWNELVVASISVPDGSIDQAEWTIGFNAKSDESRTYFVEMKGRIPVIASYDT